MMVDDMYYGRREDILNRRVELGKKQLLKGKNLTVKSLQQESISPPKSKTDFLIFAKHPQKTLMGYRNLIYFEKKALLSKILMPILSAAGIIDN